MKKILTRDTLEEILAEAVLDAEDVVYNWPSGMYSGYGGHTSFALTADTHQLAQFFMALGSLITYSDHVNGADFQYPEGRAALRDFLPYGCDPLGQGTVTYFRGWELEAEK